MVLEARRRARTLRALRRIKAVALGAHANLGRALRGSVSAPLQGLHGPTVRRARKHYRRSIGSARAISNMRDSLKTLVKAAKERP